MQAEVVGVRTSPRRNAIAGRLTITRAVSGFSLAAIQRATSRRPLPWVIGGCDSPAKKVGIGAGSPDPTACTPDMDRHVWMLGNRPPGIPPSWTIIATGYGGGNSPCRRHALDQPEAFGMIGGDER